MSEADLIEILAEYIQKTDRMLDKMAQYDKIFEKQFNRLDISYQMIISHSEKIENLQQQTKDIQQENNGIQQEIKYIREESKGIQQEIKEIREESRELNKEILLQQTKNDVLLNEILSISKRVDSIEK